MFESDNSICAGAATAIVVCWFLNLNKVHVFIVGLCIYCRFVFWLWFMYLIRFMYSLLVCVFNWFAC